MLTNEKTPAQRQLDEGQAPINAHEADTDNDPTPPPCPTWCTEGPHAYDSYDRHGILARFHLGIDHVAELDDWAERQPNGRQERAAASVQVSMLETNDSGTITFTRPTITIWSGAEDLTARDAERVAFALMRARDELLAIETVKTRQ